MKKFVFVFLVFYSSCFNGQTTNVDVLAVIDNMKQQELLWNKGDIRGFMRYYWNSDSLKFIGSKGITYGWQKTLDNYLKNYPDKEAMGTLTFKIVETISLSDTCIYSVGGWSLKKEKSVGGYFTLLWKKINNQWVIVNDHTS